MTVKLNAKTVILYLFFAAALVFINKAVDLVPLSLGLYFAMLLCGTNLIVSPILYILSSIVHLNLISSLLSLFEGVFLGLVTFLYRRTHRKIRIEAAAYAAIALAPYIAFGEWKGTEGLSFLDNAYALKGIAAVAIIAFTFFCFKTVYAIIYRAMRCKLKEDELVCCAVVYAAFGTGLYHLTGLYVYTAFAACLIIFSARLARSPAALISALILAVPPAIIALDPSPLSAYLIAAVAAYLFSNAGRIAPSLVTAALTALYAYFNGCFDCAVVRIVFRALLH